MKEAIWVERPFFNLFADAIRLDRLASVQLDNSHERRTLARASIVNSMLSTESAANCLLACHPCSSSMQESLDKLGILDKFEFLLTTRNSDALFDRGSIEIQQIQELVSLRNQYVHPKSKQREMQFASNEPDITHFQIISEKTPLLKIPRHHDYWDNQHSKAAILAVSAFLNHFFSNLCLLTPKEATRFLSKEIIHDGQHFLMFAIDDATEIRFIRDEWNAPVTFIDLASLNSSNEKN